MGEVWDVQKGGGWCLAGRYEPSDNACHGDQRQELPAEATRGRRRRVTRTRRLGLGGGVGSHRDLRG